MNHFMFNLETRDNLRLYAQEWRPAAPKAAVCLVHGIGEHSGRYAHVAAALGAAGYALLTTDLRGHGRSAGQRGHIPSYEHVMDDIGLLLGAAGSRYAGLPLFLYGHSMGGNLSLNYVLRRRPQLAGAVTTSPWLRLPVEPPRAQVALGWLMNRVYPRFSMPRGKADGMLSHDPAVDQAVAADALWHFVITPRLYFALRAAGAWALHQAASYPLPLLLMHGTGDQVTSYQASREFAERAPDCTLKLWDGLLHELHNEPEQQEVLATIITWLNAHCGS